MVRKTVEAQDERPAAGLQDRNLQSARLNRPTTDTVTGRGPTCRRILAGWTSRRSPCLGCHGFDLPAAVAASRADGAGPSSES